MTDLLDQRAEKGSRARNEPDEYYALILPLPPNAANSRRNWRVALRDKKAYWETLNMLHAAGRFKAPSKPLDRASITVHLFLWSFMDHDNAMARLKPAVDWLKGVWIVDDSPKRLVWTGLPGQSIDRRNPCMDLVLKAL